MTHFTYYDEQHAEAYVIYLDDSGTFSHAHRYAVERAQRPITYDHLSDIPEPHRGAIERRIGRKEN